MVPASALLELGAAAAKLLLSDDVQSSVALTGVALCTLAVPSGRNTALQMTADGSGSLEGVVLAPGATPAMSAMVLLSGFQARTKSGDLTHLLTLAGCLQARSTVEGSATATLSSCADRHLPVAVCESISALNLAHTGQEAVVYFASCNAVLLPQSSHGLRGIDFLTVSPAQEAQFSASLHAQRASFAGLRAKICRVPASKATFGVVWRRQQLQESSLSGARWLLLGSNTCSLAKICQPALGDDLHTLSARFWPSEASRDNLGTTVEIVAAAPAHLHWLLKSSAPTQLLAVADDQQAAESDSLYHGSLAWVHSARDLAAIKPTISSITVGTRHGNYVSSQGGPSTAGACAVGVSKARFMEDRTGHATAIDIDPASQPLSARQLAWLLQSSEAAVAVRTGHMFVERLETSSTCAASRPRRKLVLNPGMCCVVTGGTKGLGLQYAKYLAQAGCKRLVLTSRGGELNEAEAEQLRKLGTEVVVKACDAGDTASCAAFATWLHETMPAVQLFVHAAGLIRFDLVPDLTKDAFESEVMPKVVGADVLHARGIPAEGCLLFSSTAAVWSQAGAAHYSAGNACLDAAAAQSQAMGLPGTAVNFGPFGGEGMAGNLG